MAINATGMPLTIPYKPAAAGADAQPPIQGICVHAGDRIMLVSNRLTTGNVSPDGTAGAGAGYMPHWVYTPYWSRLQDVNEPPNGGEVKLYDGLNGNAALPPTIRADLAYLYCPWAGLVTIEGGAGTGGATIEIAYAWDQQARQRQKWWDLPAQILTRLARPQGTFGALKFPRLPVDMRKQFSTTLTFWNAYDGFNRPLPIQRPHMAVAVWTPDSNRLILDNGAGTTSSTVQVNGQSNAAPLGPFSRVTAVSDSVPCIIFGLGL